MKTAENDDPGPVSRAESKHEKFRRMAYPRVEKTLQQLRLIGNLGNRASYDYSSDEVGQIFSALQDALSGARERFMDRRAQQSFRFRND